MRAVFGKRKRPNMDVQTIFGRFRTSREAVWTKKYLSESVTLSWRKDSRLLGVVIVSRPKSQVISHDLTVTMTWLWLTMTVTLIDYDLTLIDHDRDFGWLWLDFDWLWPWPFFFLIDYDLTLIDYNRDFGWLWLDFDWQWPWLWLTMSDFGWRWPWLWLTMTWLWLTMTVTLIDFDWLWLTLLTSPNCDLSNTNREIIRMLNRTQCTASATESKSWAWIAAWILVNRPIIKGSERYIQGWKAVGVCLTKKKPKRKTRIKTGFLQYDACTQMSEI